MPKAQTYQCPNCGGVLNFDAESGKLRCEFCDSEFDEQELAGEIPVGDAAVEKGETTHATSVEDFLERAPWEVSADGTVNAVVYSCPSCAAAVAADQATVATQCPYCGNNMLVQGLATDSNIPTYVMPFTVTRQEAEKRMRAHFEHKWYLSRAFDAELRHMQGMYIPYHLYDIDVEGWADYIGYESETSTDSDGNSHETRYYYPIKRAGHASFERIPVDGSSKMPDAHMDAIAPFDFQKMQPFTAAFAAGYLMEVADEDAEVCEPRATARARTSFEEDLKNDARHERRVDGIEETVSSNTDVTVREVSSAVLPVWMMHCTWEDEQMLFAVNGDTGKCVGNLPVEGRRRATTIAATAGVLALISILLYLLVLSGSDSNTLGYFAGAIVVVALITFFVDSHFMSQMRTAVEAKNAAMSYDSEGLVVTDRWVGKRRGSANRARKDL